MRIAVVGASGFVGTHLVRAGAAAGHEMVGLVRRPEAREGIARLGGKGVLFESFSDPRLAEALGGSEMAVHLAQISGERGGATYEGVNVRGTRELLESCLRAGVPRVAVLSGLGVARYGIAPYSTNPYFLSKLAAEVELFRSGLEAVVFRPSYIVGPGDPLMSLLLSDLAKGDVEIVGDALYRLQPVAVADAVEGILRAVILKGTRVFDLVGPEPLRYRDFVERVAPLAHERGLKAEVRFREVSVAEAKTLARKGGYRGLLEDEVDVILCDEVSESGPLETLLSRPLTPLDAAVRAALESFTP